MCRLCGQTYRVISFSHLRSAHGWEKGQPVEVYKQRFGLPTATCRDTRRILTALRNEKWERLGRHWTRGRIVEALRQRAREGKDLAVSRLPAPLWGAIVRHYGTWATAMRRAHISTQAHRLRGRWDMTRLIAAIRSRLRDGLALAASVVRQADRSLYCAGERICGNWGAALRAAGLDAQDHKKPRKWGLRQARDWVAARVKAGLPITTRHVPIGLLNRVRRDTSRGWIAFVESLGIPYPGVRKRWDWTDAGVLAGIRARRRHGLPLNWKAVAADGQGLTHQARQRFGSWDAALRRAHINPDEVRRCRHWTRDDVLRAIRKRHDARRPMGRAATKADDHRLVKAAQTLFPYSWARALAAAGLDPALARAPRKAQGKR